MPSDLPIKVFDVKVGKDNTIRVGGSGIEEIPDCAVTVDPLQRRTTQVLVNMLREGRLVDEEEFKVLGQNLYNVLFSNDIGEAVRKSFFEPLGFMRVELGFEEGQEQLSSWPWEYLYCPQEFGKVGTGYFLAQQDSLILTRRIKLDCKPRGLRIDKPPLKVLFVASSPKLANSKDVVIGEPGKDAPRVLKVEYDSVLDQIKDLGEDIIKVTALLPEEKFDDEGRPVIQVATWENFKAKVQNEEPHVIHFLGHGKWDPIKESGAILFMGRDGTVDARWENDLANLFMKVPSVRLVFLQACESAQSDPYQAFSGVAQQLAQKGIPAVVGMQTKINNQVANQFARSFYTALADKLTIDAAVQKARTTMSDAPSDSAQRLGFGLPVLYLQKSDSLFPPSVTAATPTGGQDRTLSELVACPWCSHRNRSVDNFCAVCDGQVVCLKCGTRVSEPRLSCGNCGTPLRQRRPDNASSSTGESKFADS